MAKQKRKWRHHYVPQLTLRKFTDNQGLLHYIDRARNERRPADIPRNIGYGRDFYYLDDTDNPNSLEDAFGKIESKAGPVIEKVIERRKAPTEKDDWLHLMYFVALQAMRVPSTKGLIARPIHRERQIIVDMIKHDQRLYRRNAHMVGIDPEQVTYEEFLAMPEEDIIEELTNAEFFEFSMAMANPIVQSIHKRLWTVVHSDEPGEHFVVSDDPVTLYWSDGVYRRFPPGYMHQDADVTIPLSSEVALILTYPDFEVPKDGVRHQVARINSRTIAASQHFVAARSHSFIYYVPAGIIETSELREAPAIPPIVI